MPKLDSEFHLLTDNLLVFKITLYSLLYILGLEITKMKPLNHLIVVLDTFIRSGRGQEEEGRAILMGREVRMGEQKASSPCEAYTGSSRQCLGDSPINQLKTGEKTKQNTKNQVSGR